MVAVFVPPGSFVNLSTAGSPNIIVVIIRRKLHATKRTLQSGKYMQSGYATANLPDWHRSSNKEKRKSTASLAELISD